MYHKDEFWFPAFLVAIVMGCFVLLERAVAQDFGDRVNEALRLHNERCDDEDRSLINRADNCLWAGEIYESVKFYSEALGQYNKACELVYPSERHCTDIDRLQKWLKDTSDQVLYKSYPPAEFHYTPEEQ